MSSVGYDNRYFKRVNEKARMLLNFHNEVPNTDNATSDIFSEVTSNWIIT